MRGAEHDTLHSNPGMSRLSAGGMFPLGQCLWTLCLASAVLFAYAPILTSYFLSDDFAMLAFARDPWPTLFSFREPWFRPLGLALWKVSCSLAGDSVAAQHLLNLLFHFANSLLLYRLAVSLGQGRAAGQFAALAFCVFPIHPEAVSWLSGRFDLLCTFFYLLATLLFVAHLERRNSALPLVGSVLCFLLALLSKEMAFSLVLVLPVLLLLLRPRADWRMRVVVLLPFVLTALAVAAFRLLHAGPTGVYDFQFKISLSSFRLVWSPLGALFFPWNTRLVATSLWPVLLLFGMVTFFYLLVLKGFWEEWPVTAGFGLVLYLTVLPLWNLDRVYSNLQNARFYYLPSAVFVVWLAHRATCRRLPSFFLVAYLLASAGLLFVHNLPWREAGALSHRIVSELRQLPEGPKKLHGLPDSYLGAYISRNGVDVINRSVGGIGGPLCWKDRAEDAWRGHCAAEGTEYRWNGVRFLPLLSSHHDP